MEVYCVSNVYSFFFSLIHTNTHTQSHTIQTNTNHIPVSPSYTHPSLLSSPSHGLLTPMLVTSDPTPLPSYDTHHLLILSLPSFSPSLSVNPLGIHIEGAVCGSQPRPPPVMASVRGGALHSHHVSLRS